MSSAISSFGTLLKIGDGGGPETFTTIAEVIDIKGPKLKANTEDTTNHSSAASFEEFVVTTLSAGEISFKINFVPTGATHSYSTGLLKDFVNKTMRNFKLVLPNIGATTWTFAAAVTAFDLDAPTKGKLSADVTLKINGQPTLA